MTEAFDCWAEGKNPQDYHVFFNEWWRRDLAAMVLRDRNHPSVVMWSIGNEIPMRFTHAGTKYSAMMVQMVHDLNPGSGQCTQTAAQHSTAQHNKKKRAWARPLLSLLALLSVPFLLSPASPHVHPIAGPLHVQGRRTKPELVGRAFGTC